MKRILALGTVHQGQLTLSRRAQFDAELRQLNGPVLVTVERETRTLRQNALYFLRNQIVAEHLGWTVEEVHEFSKSQCNLLTKMVTDAKTGEILEYKFGGSTASLPKDAFSEYMERCRMYWLTEHEIELPDPEEESGCRESM